MRAVDPQARQRVAGTAADGNVGAAVGELAGDAGAEGTGRPEDEEGLTR